MSDMGIKLSRCAARCGAGGLLIVSLIIGGLVSVPTVCACGSAHPHAHTLLSLPGHWHGNVAVPQDTEQPRLMPDGPALGAGGPIGISFGVAVLADQPALVVDEQHGQVILRDVAVFTGHVERPESPPPRG
ncbi:MAG: hypothetical protein DCC58_15845 [Chloroflexi bacterium]|nr:MAG: hypothetical protein DCC58_15845 [Chloroflexota bacterium]